MPLSAQRETRHRERLPPWVTNFLPTIFQSYSVQISSLGALQIKDINATTQPSGMALLNYILGSAGIVHLRNYAANHISVQRGIFIGENNGAAATLVWRKTTKEEHPNFLALWDNEDDERFTAWALE